MKHFGLTTAAVAAVAAGLAVTGCAATASGITATSPGRQPSFGATAGAAVQQAAVILPGAAGTATASGIPWSRVGTGWALAEYTKGSNKRAAPVSLYLVSPAGGTYLVHRWPATKSPWELIAWSGDKKRALFEKFDSATPVLQQLTLANGTVTGFGLPSIDDNVLGYTRPNGQNLLVDTGHGITRFSLTGQQQVRLIAGRQYDSAIAAPNGLTDIVGSDQGLVLVSNAGGVVRRLPVPGSGAQWGGCRPSRWWNSSTVLASCMPKPAGGGLAIPRLWLVPVSGATPRAITPVRNGKDGDYGDVDGWRFPSGLYVQALGGCGTEFIGRQAPGVTNIAVVTVPGSEGNNVVVATSGDRMLVQERTECTPGSSIVWFNPATHAVQKVLHAPAKGDGVLGVVAYNGNGEES